MSTLIATMTQGNALGGGGGGGDAEALQSQIQALEGQLERARLEEQVRQLEKQIQEAAAAQDGEEIVEEEEVEVSMSEDPEGEVMEEYYDYEDESVEEIIVIEEIVEDGEEYDDEVFEIVEEEYYEDDEEEYEEEVEEEEEEEEEEVEEIIEEEVVDDSHEQQQAAAAPKAKIGRTWESPKTKPLRQAAPPMVSLVDQPRQFEAPPDAKPAASSARKSWGAPKAVPAKDAAAAAVNTKKTFLEPDKKNGQEQAPPEQAPAAGEKPRRKWNPLSKRQPEKYKKTAKDVREQPKKKTTKLVPLPFSPRKYPTVPPSAQGSETPIEKMLGPQLYKNVKLQKMSVTSAMQDQELVCLYFGAAWRPECKAFHQNLIDFYKLTSKDTNTEIVYVSVDKTLFAFKEIFARFPFLAMPTGTTTLKNTLTKQLGITELPVFCVFEVATGNVVTVNGVEDLSKLPSRDKEAAINLVEQWKSQKSTPLSSFKPNKKLKVGANKGNLIWNK